MPKKQTGFRLDQDTLDYLDNYKKEHGLSDRTKAILAIIDEVREKNSIDTTEIFIQHFSKQVANEIMERLDTTLTRIRLGTNNADRNSDVILLALNQLLASSPLKAYVEKEMPQLTRAKIDVAEKIANLKQRSSNKQKKIKKSSPVTDSDFIDDSMIID